MTGNHPGDADSNFGDASGSCFGWRCEDCLAAGLSNPTRKQNPESITSDG
jgi:hypothetical protein